MIVNNVKTSLMHFNKTSVVFLIQLASILKKLLMILTGM